MKNSAKTVTARSKQMSGHHHYAEGNSLIQASCLQRKMGEEEIERIITDKISKEINKYKEEKAWIEKKLAVISLGVLFVIIMFYVIFNRYMDDKKIERSRKQQEYIQTHLQNVEERLM